MASIDVYVVRDMFMLDGAYLNRGDVISDPDKMARAWASHGSAKLIPAKHDAPDAPVVAAPAPVPAFVASSAPAPKAVASS